MISHSRLKKVDIQRMFSRTQTSVDFDILRGRIPKPDVRDGYQVYYSYDALRQVIAYYKAKKKRTYRKAK